MNNTTIDAILAQKEAEYSKSFKNDKKTAYDEKNYLSARLLPTETKKTLIVRLLPYFDEGTPFHKVHFHTVKVNKAVSSSGWKSFPCPVKNEMGTKCPFCEVSQEARALKLSASNVVDKQRYEEIEKANRSRDMFVVRCIERGHEEDGVKFWLFPKAFDGKGVYDQMINILNTRNEKAKSRGEAFYNVFDIENGKDMFVTLTRKADGKTSITIADDDEKTPLSTDRAQMEKWLNDDKRWENVYTIKQQYMKIVLCGGVPFYDKEKGMYVDRDEMNAEKKAEEEKKIAEAYTAPKVDYSVAKPIEMSSGLGQVVDTFVDEKKPMQTPQQMMPSFMDDEDDLPF